MKTCKSIKRLLGNNEEVKVSFTLSARFLKIRMIVTLLVCLIVFIIIGFGARLFTSRDNLMDSVNYDIEKGFSYEQPSSGFLNQGIDRNTIVLWLLLVAAYLLVVLPMAWFYNFYYLKITNQYAFSNQRVIIKRGWLNTKITTIHYNRMTDASVMQDFIDKIIGIGGLSISTAGSEGYKVELTHIDHPSQKKKELFDLKEDYRQRLYRGDQAVESENRDIDH